jgi:hypothetical protein
LGIPVPQKQSAFHPHAQRNASRRRDVRQQSRSFVRWNQSLRRSPNSQKRKKCLDIFDAFRVKGVCSRELDSDTQIHFATQPLSGCWNFFGAVLGNGDASARSHDNGH